jgi:Trypsin
MIRTLARTRTRPRVIGGHDVQDQSRYPYFSFMRAQVMCAGTLIGPDLVLSAAHVSTSCLVLACVCPFWNPIRTIIMLGTFLTVLLFVPLFRSNPCSVCKKRLLSVHNFTLLACFVFGSFISSICLVHCARSPLDGLSGVMDTG